MALDFSKDARLEPGVPGRLRQAFGAPEIDCLGVARRAKTGSAKLQLGWKPVDPLFAHCARIFTPSVPIMGTSVIEWNREI